jgi:hypothetical protein
MTTTTTTMTMMDASLLRNALRLIHCLQKERGASCAYFASDQQHYYYNYAPRNPSYSPTLPQPPPPPPPQANEARHQHFETAMEQARQATNVAIHLLADHVENQQQLQQIHDDHPPELFLRNSGSTPIRNNLRKIRNLIDSQTQQNQGRQGESTATTTTTTTTPSSSSLDQQPTLQQNSDQLAFHRIFVCFNTLVGFVANEYVLKQTGIAVDVPPPAVSRQRQKLISRGGSKSVFPSSPVSSPSSSSLLLLSSSLEKERRIRPMGHTRGLSGDINDKLSSAWRMSPRGGGGEGLGSKKKQGLNPMLHRIESNDDVNDNNNNNYYDDAEDEPRGDTIPLPISKAQYKILLPPLLPPQVTTTRASQTGQVAPNADDDPPVETTPKDAPEGEAAVTLMRRVLSSTDLYPNNEFIHMSQHGVGGAGKGQPVYDYSKDAPPPPPPPPPPSLEQQRRYLMDLLHCFVQLKESTGVERAILSSLLAFKNAALFAEEAAAAAAAAQAVPSTTTILNDLLFMGEKQPDTTTTASTTTTGSGTVPPSSTSSFTKSLSISSTASRLLSDLIVEVENQHRLIAKLNDLPDQNGSSSGSASAQLGMSHLVLELVQLSPSLQELQNKILTNPEEFLHHGGRRRSRSTDDGGDDQNEDDEEEEEKQAGGVVYDSETIFQVITMYMDKLHSLELLIIEELESCCQSSVRRHPSDSSLPTTMAYQHESGRIMPPTTGQMVMTDSPHRQQPPSQSSNLPRNLSFMTTASEASRTPKMHSLSLALQRYVLGGVPNNQAKHNGVDKGMADFVLTQLEAMSAQALKEIVMAALQQEAANTQQQQQHQQHQQLSSNMSMRGVTAESLDDKINTALAPSNNAGGRGGHHSDEPTTQEQSPLDDFSSNNNNNMHNKEWEIGIYEIKFQRRIGQGACGTTYRATWSGLSVAVKVASITDFGLEGWRTEVAALQKLHHPYVIRLLGCVYHENPLTFCLVLEYCNAGGKC